MDSVVDQQAKHLKHNYMRLAVEHFGDRGEILCSFLMEYEK